MTVITTVDDKIVQAQQSIPEPEPVIQDEVVDEQVSKSEDAPKSESQEEYQLPEAASSESSEVDTSKDDFGNPVESKKVYTEEEVNKMMRERFNRTAQKHQEPVQQVQTQTQDYNDQDPEVIIENLVENTINKISQRERQRAQEAQEQQRQQEFQEKVINGMGRYKDFEDVVKKVPWHDNLVLATRAMKDPAAFMYAASKTQPKEVERIAQMSDPLAQAVEIGKLEERMRKVRSATSTPKPLGEVKGDIENRSFVRQNVDDLVRKDALKKLSRRA